MTDDELNNIKLHVAGATVRHSNPFENLPTHKNDFELDREFLHRLVKPYYMNIPVQDQDKKGIEEIGKVKTEFARDVVKKLLGDFDWRTRQTGAYFAAINDLRDFEDTIGTLLLKSEVAYAGRMYVLVLAVFNTNSGLKFLTTYLDYYLTKPDLFFDQQRALEAVKYLDEINGTNHFEAYPDRWNNYLQNKPHWNRYVNTDRLRNEIAAIHKIQAYNSQP